MKKRALLLGQTEKLVFDPDTGKYPLSPDQEPTQHQAEVRAAIRYAVSVLGKDQTWNAMDRTTLRTVWRNRLRGLVKAGHTGVRGAEITLSRLLTVVRWLQDEGKIAMEAAQPGRGWRREIASDWKQITGAKSDPEVLRPRHTVEEMRKIIEQSRYVDPRAHLLLVLGAELRLGMVARLQRSQVNLLENTISIPSSGQKRGVKLYLTPGQGHHLAEDLQDGYLRRLERLYSAGDIDDYHLFPAGRLVRFEAGRLIRFEGAGGPVAGLWNNDLGHVSRSTMQWWFRFAERLAGVPHRRGRGAYGLRRGSVDGAKDRSIDRDALKEFGGWTDTQMPDMVYASQEQAEAGKRARDIRSKIRGEADEPQS